MATANDVTTDNLATAIEKYKPPPILTKPDFELVRVKQIVDIFLVLFDLETTSFNNDADICQIAALPISDRMKNWTHYILPRKDVKAEATTVNGLSINVNNKGERYMTKNGIEVESIPYEEGIKQFYHYICERGVQAIKENPNTKLLLVAHNAFSFDAQVLINAFISIGINPKALAKKNIGFADSLPLLREMRRDGNSVLTNEKGKSLSLPNLYIALFGDSYTAHDAFEDVQALYKVLFESELHVTTEQILSHSCTVTSFIKRMKFHCETKKRNQTFKGTLAPKQYNDKRQHKDREITSEMAHKMAESGLAYEDLKDAYKKEGAQGLERVLKQEREDGKPRVTKHKRVINTVVNHFQFQEEYVEGSYACKLQKNTMALEQPLDQVQMLVDSTPCLTHYFEKCQSELIQPSMLNWQVEEGDKLHVKKSNDLKYEDIGEKSKVELDYYKEKEPEHDYYKEDEESEPDYYEEDEEPEPDYYEEDEEPEPDYYEEDEEPEPDYYEEDEEPEPDYYEEDEEPEPDYYEEDEEPEPDYYEEDEEPEPDYYYEDEEPESDYYEDEEPEPDYYEEEEEPEPDYYEEDEEPEPDYYEEDEEPESDYYEDEEPEPDYYYEDEEPEPDYYEEDEEPEPDYYYEDEEPECNYYEDEEPEPDYYEEDEEPEPDYYEEDEEPEPDYYEDKKPEPDYYEDYYEEDEEPEPNYYEDGEPEPDYCSIL